jgi:hypothetical protein
LTVAPPWPDLSLAGTGRAPSLLTTGGNGTPSLSTAGGAFRQVAVFRRICAPGKRLQTQDRHQASSNVFFSTFLLFIPALSKNLFLMLRQALIIRSKS